MNKDTPEKSTCSWEFVGGTRALAPDEIVYIENYLHRATFHLRDGRELHIYRKMSELERDLAGYGFVRAHQSYLVNLRDIRDVRDYRLRLKDGSEFSVPRPRFAAVKQAFFAYRGQDCAPVHASGEFHRNDTRRS